MRLVVALGGNAITRRGEKGTASEQRASIREACDGLAYLVAAGHALVVTHGNGPQVGAAMIQQHAARASVPAMPLDVLVAQTQGQIGYVLQQELTGALHRRGVERPVVSLITQVVVDAADPAFIRPTKPVGPYLSEEEARDLRRASIHDRHAAERIIEIGKRHPGAVIMVLFGESHLAPGHLPRILRRRFPEKGLLTVLQNVDALYWRAVGESCQIVHAVRVTDEVVCVFNSTPLEKYESYRLCLDRWGETEPDAPDLSPAVYNLIDGLLRFLNISCYAPHNGTQPKFLVDLLPEVYCHPSDAAVRKVLFSRDSAGADSAVLQRLEECGSVYIAKTNTLFIREFRMPYAAQEVARFLHHACRGLPESRSLHPGNGLDQGDALYAEALETALVFFAARVLCPFGADLAPVEFECDAERLGYALGAGLYDAYVQGRVTKTFLRRLFLTRLEEPGTAHKIYLGAARRAGVALANRLA